LLYVVYQGFVPLWYHYCENAWIINLFEWVKWCIIAP